jgi:hypothetical protein
VSNEWLACSGEIIPPVKRRGCNCNENDANGYGEESLKVDRAKFEGIIQNLLNTKPLTRSKVKVSKRKPENLIPSQK